MVLTDEEIYVYATWGIAKNEAYSFREFARAIESAVLEKLKAQEPYEIEYPEYHQHGRGCGLEDRNITDRYKAMAYGWDCAIDAMAECIPDRLYEHPLPPDDVVRDAARYRWLRNHGTGFCEFAIYVDEDGISQRGSRFNQIPEMLDAAVDAAMEKIK